MDAAESKHIDKLLKITDKFAKSMNKIMNMLDSKFPDGDVDLYVLKKRMALCHSISADMLISRCWNKIYEMRTYIMTRNEAYLLDDEVEAKLVSKYIKKDEREEWMKNMIKTLKGLWPKATPEEKELVWQNMLILLQASAEYMMLMGYHN